MDRTNLVALLKARELRDGKKSGPLYKRLAEALNGLIAEGVVRPGVALPPERELAEALSVSRVTVRTGYKELLASGVLESRHGSGTFVSRKTARIEQPLWHLSSFSEDMRSRGKTPAARILDRRIAKPAPDEAFLLGLEADEQVVHLDRLRLADNVPLAIERAVVPLKYLGGDGHGETSLYEALDRRGYRPVRALQRLKAVTLDQQTANILGVDAGSAALLIERISRLPDQQVVEYTRSHYRGDMYDFVAELKIGEPD